MQVEVTNRGAIYVDNIRITDRSTKWGVHNAIDCFEADETDVVKLLFERGHSKEAARITDEPYRSQLPAA